ncbi:hypothetical protein HA402_004488 [Bradysia odoriphaga]|nr:hypothetical protein HA402_004488 [Bradysia odoriphaga]
MTSVSIEFILFAILLVSCVHCSKNETVKSAENSDIIPRARQLVNNFLNKTENEFVPGLVISVSVKGEQKWLEAFGKANIENNVPMTGDTVMQIGSITKSFIVGLASRLMQENKLDFDVPIRKYLSVRDFPDKTWNGNVVNITLRQLFQMRAGIPSLDGDLVGKCLRCKKQLEHLIFMRDKELEFEPGTNFTYSNFGYELAGAVVESVLENKTLDDAVKEMIDNVLKLNKTAIYDSHMITPHIASFYTIINGSLFNSGMWGDIFLNELHAAGGIMTTMTDLVIYGQIWLDAYYGRSEQFLKQSSVRSAWVPSSMSSLIYGMGWVIQNNTSVNRRSGNQVIWHSGGTNGCRSMLAIYPETEIIIAASANLGQCRVEALILEGTIADLFAINETTEVI